MATIELERGTAETVEADDDEQHDDTICHLYQCMTVAVCGVPAAQDKHAGTHTSVAWKRGEMSCPICGTPICLDCILECS